MSSLEQIEGKKMEGVVRCHLCGFQSIRLLGCVGIREASVTSDSKLCDVFSKIYCCTNCDHLQKLYTEKELNQINNLYNTYEPHYLSQGEEQVSFHDDRSPVPRTYHALEQCIHLLPEEGKLLDVGTGTGAVLKTAAKLLPKWTLYAFDVADTNIDEIFKIKNVVEFTASSVKDLPEKKFDLIVLWQVLEHIPEPLQILNQLVPLLSKNGFFLIQVPDVTRGPFDLAVFDHCSHFSPKTFDYLINSAGLKIILDGYDWTHNCLTFLLKLREFDEKNSLISNFEIASEQYFIWINRIVNYFEELTKEKNYVLFGAGMAGIWLLSQFSRNPLYIIDEDKRKDGCHIKGIQICLPSKAPKGVPIVMPFTYESATRIVDRLRKRYVEGKNWQFLLTEIYNVEFEPP